MRKAWIPETLILSGLGDAAFRTLMVLALHKDKEDRCYLTNEKIACILNKDSRRVRADLMRAEHLGLIQRKYTERGQRFFCLIVNECTEDGKRPGVTNNVPQGGRKTSGGEDTQRPGGRTENVLPPNNPLIGTTVLNNLSQQHTNTNAGGREAERPQAPDTECVSVSGDTSLPQSQPRTEIPEDLKRMTSQLQLESWVGDLQFQGESLDDWRVRETLGVIYAQGGKKGSRYAWGIYRNLPKERPAVTDFVQNAKGNDEQRKARNLARLEALK